MTQIKTIEDAMEVVTRKGNALHKVPLALRTREVCLAALRQNGYAIWHVPNKTSEIYLAAVSTSPEVFYSLPEKFKTPEFCLAAVKNNYKLLMDMEPELLTPEICLAAIGQDPEMEKYSPYSPLELMVLA